MDCIRKFQQKVNITPSVAECLQEAMHIFTEKYHSLLTGVILDRLCIERDATYQPDVASLLDHIIFSDPLTQLTGFEVRSGYHAKNFPGLPVLKSIGGFLSIRIESHITGTPIAILWAAKQRKFDLEEQEQEHHHEQEPDQKQHDWDGESIAIETDQSETFSEEEVQCFLSLASIAKAKVRLEANTLELNDQKKETKKSKVMGKKSERNVIELQHQQERLQEQLATAHNNIHSLKVELTRISQYEYKASCWTRNEKVDRSLSTLDVINGDKASHVKDKLRASLGELLDVAPSACSVALRPFEDSNMTPQYLPFLSAPNVINDSLQCILSYRNITLGRIATPRVSKEGGKHEILQEWIRRASQWLYLWRQSTITTRKEQFVKRAEQRMNTILQSMEKITSERDKLLRLVTIAAEKLEQEQAERLRLEGSCAVLSEQAWASTQHVHRHTESDASGGSIEKIEDSFYGIEDEKSSMQRRIRELTLKVQTQARQISQQQELHVQQMTLNAASEKNAVVRITELQISLKESQKQYDTLKTKYENNALRFQQMLRTSKSLLGTTAGNIL